MLADVGHGLCARKQELEGVNLHNHLKVRHFVCGKAFPDNIVDKEDLGLAVVYKIVNITRLELVQDGHRDSSISKGCKETYAPVGLVPGTNRHFVAFFKAALLKGNLQFCYSAGYIPVTECCALIIRKCRTIPMLPEALLQEFVY